MRAHRESDGRRISHRGRRKPSEGDSSDAYQVGDAWHIGRQLAEYVQKFPELEGELKKRYEAAGSGRGRLMLEHFFGEAASESDLIAMVDKYVVDGRNYDGLMDRAVRAIALEEVPISEDSNAYNIYPAPVATLRKTLFDLAVSSPQKSAIAKACLEAIDELRDEYGIASGDGRHPDVMSERPWPDEARLQ